MPVTTSTEVTYHRSSRSMTRCERGTSFWAFSTRRMIFENRLSSARRVTSTSSDPLPFIVPANTSSPSPLSTGRDSPVMEA